MPSETESALIIDIVFWVLAASTIVAAVAVVQLRDLFKAALFLIVSFIGVAGLFVLMRAEFLGVVQILIYVGAISVLIIFAVLMTRDVEQGSPPNRLRIPAGIVAVLFVMATAFVALNTDWNLIEAADAPPSWAGAAAQNVNPGDEVDCPTKAEDVKTAADVYCNTVPRLASLLLGDFVLAFEIASVLLLAAIIGAVALVRER